MRGTIAKVLNKALGDFIEGINADDFHFSLSQGRVELANLRLKKEFFHTLNLPLELVASYVGSLTLDIPFKNLKTKPIVVELSQVYATLAPSPDIDPNVMQRSKLEGHDKAWATAKEDETQEEEEEGEAGMAAKYTQKIMDNIQVTIQDIHLRYEDGLSSQRSTWENDTGNAFAAGLTIDSIELRSFFVDLATGAWEKKFVEEEQRYLNKMLTIGQAPLGQAQRARDDLSPVKQSGVAVYINHGEQPYADPGSEAWKLQMWNAIARDGHPARDMSYAFGPMSMEVQLSIDKEKNKDAETSRVWQGEDGSSNEVAVHFAGIEVHLRQKHASIGVNLLSWMQNIYRWREFDQRPEFPPSLGINAREWWMFAGRCIVEQVRKNREARNIENVRESLRRVQTYVTLYERHSRNERPHLKNLTEKEEEFMREIEDSSTFDTVVACRTIAWHRLLAYDMKQEEQGKPRKMTLAQIEMVDPRRAMKLRDPVQFKPDVSFAKVRLENERFSFQLSQASTPLMHLVVDTFDIQGHMYGNGGGGAQVSIHGLTVHDKFTHNPIFPQIVQRHDSGASDQPVFHLAIGKKIESKVESGGANAVEKIQQTVSVNLEMQPLQIIANYNMLPVLKNFTDFDGNDADFTETKLKAANAFNNLVDEYMLQISAAAEALEVEQATVNRMVTHMAIGGPVLCLPQSFTLDDSDPIVLVVDTGRITVETSQNAVSEYDVSKVTTRGAEVYYCPTNTYFSQHKQVLHMWCKYDADSSGSLSRDEIKGLLNEVTRNRLTDVELEEHIKDMDEDESGEIEFDEFLDYYKARLHVEWLWSQADADESGSLDKPELKTVLELLGKRTTDAVFEKTWAALDADKSGEIDKTEFMDWWRLSGRFTGKKMVLVDSARLQGDVSVCTKFDPTLPKMIASFQLSSTEIRISDREIRDLAALGAAVLSSIKVPDPLPPVKTAPKSAASRVEKDAPKGKIANKVLMGSEGFDTTFKEDAGKAKVAETKKTKAEQAVAWRKAAKKVNAASVTSMTTSSVKVNAEPTKAELAQRALKEWTLMDVVVHVEDLHIVLSADDGQTDVMEVHLRGLGATVLKRPLDQDVVVGFKTFEILDCQQVEHERADTHALLVEDVALKMLTAQAKSPYAIDYVPLSNIDAKIERIDAGVRMGLVQELADFGEVASSYVQVLADPEQAALDTAQTKVEEAEEVRDKALEAKDRVEQDISVADDVVEQLEQAYRAAEEKLAIVQLTETKARRALEMSNAQNESKAASGANADPARAPPKPEVIDTTKQTINLGLGDIGLRLVPDREEQGIVSDFRVNQISANIVQELGGMQVEASIGSMVLMHGELPDTLAAVVADENIEKAILVWAHDGGCMALELKQPSPRDTRKPPMVVKVRVSGLELMVSAGFLEDVGSWALHNPFMDALNAKKTEDSRRLENTADAKPPQCTTKSAEKQKAAAPEPEAEPSPPMEFDATIEKLALLVPNESAASGLRVGVERLAASGSTVPDQQDISLEGLSVWTYIGGHHHLRSSHKRNRHMVVAEPLSLGVAVRTVEDSKKTVSLSHPGAFVIRISYCDVRLLKQLGDFITNTIDEIKPSQAPELEPEPEPEWEATPKPQQTDPQGQSNDGPPTVDLGPLKLSLYVYDDAAARNRARLLFSASVLVQQMALQGPKTDVGIGLSLSHYDKRGVMCPLVEPLQVTVALNSETNTTSVSVENKVNLVVSEPLLVDLQRIGAIWPEQLEKVEAAGLADDYEAIVVKNETGVDLSFGKAGGAADMQEFAAGMQATLTSFETNLQTQANIHMQLAGQQHGHHDIEDCRSPVGDVDELVFKLGSHNFTASTSTSTVRHLEPSSGKKKKTENTTIISVDISRQGAKNVMQVYGTVSVRNGLPVPVTVSVRTPKFNLFEAEVDGVSQDNPTGTKCGMPLKVRADDNTATLTIRRGDSTADIGLTELLNGDDSVWLLVDDTWICLSVTLVQVRSRSADFTGDDQPSTRQWVQKAAIDISPGLQVVSLVPEFPLQLSYDGGGATSTYNLEAAGGDSSGQPTELLLKGLASMDEDVSITAKLVMHGVEYTTSTPCLIHSTKKELGESMTLSSTQERNLPIRLEVLHDTLSTGARVVRIWAAYCLVNTSGLPIMVCLDDQYGPEEDELPAVRTLVKEKREPNQVKEWLCHKKKMERDISLLPGADGTKLRIKVGHDAGSWSDPFRVDNPGTGGLVEIMGGEHGDTQLGVDTTSDNPGSAKTSAWCPDLQAAPPTKYVRLFPRTVVANHTGVPLYVAQASTADETKHTILQEIGELQNEEMTVLEFPKLEKQGVQKSMALRLSPDVQWSGAINCDTVQQVPIWLRDGPDGDLLVHITVRTMDNIMFIHITLESAESPAFCLRNNIGSAVTIRQIGCEPESVVPVGATSILGWDFPERDKKFTAEYSDGRTSQVIELSPETVGSHPKASGVYVTVEGGTRTINFTSSREQDKWKAEVAEEEEEEAVEEGAPEKGKETILVLVDGVGVSLVSTARLHCQEIIAVNVGEIKLEIDDDEMRQTMQLSVQSIQVDSMLVKSPTTPVAFPVILRAMTGLEEHGHTIKPALSVTTVTRKQPVPWAQHMDAVSVLLQEIELQVELGLLVPILEFVHNMSVQLQLELPEYSEKAETNRLEFAEFSERNGMDEPILFMRFLQIHPISIKLSFQMGKVAIPPVARPFAVIAKSIASIDESPIKLTSIVINDACGYKSEVTGKIGMHYAQQGKGQVYKIIGSIGILGNPVGLVNKLGSGITMFFYEPIQGIQQGPGHFIAGIGQGTAALVGGTVEGAFHAPAEVTAALSQGLSALSDTGSHAGSGQKAHSTMQGLGFMAHDFGHDLNKTVTSIFIAPVKGAQKDGASGFVKGIGKGLVQSGAAGAALGVDLASNLTGALGHLLSNPLGHPNPPRIRLRRVVHRGGVLEHWNETRAKGQAMFDAVRVHQAKHRKKMHQSRHQNGPNLGVGEYYNDHFEVKDHNVLILADDHVLLVKEEKRSSLMDMTARETRAAKENKVELLWSIRIDSIKNAVRTVQYSCCTFCCDACSFCLQLTLTLLLFLSVCARLLSAVAAPVVTTQAVHVSDHFNGVILTLESLANTIKWDALEVPIGCKNADDAKQIHTLLEDLADAPTGEPWAVPVVGEHLKPDGMGEQLEWTTR